MTINLTQAIVFGIIGLIQGIILTDWVRDKRELKHLKVK